MLPLPWSLQLLAAAQPPPPPPSCDCAGFCAGSCSLPTAADLPSLLTLYRLTPTNVTDLANKDTGDAEGDAFFTLDEYDLPMRCINGSGTQARGCFLDVTDIYMQFEVAVDGKYGPYGHCNPPEQNSLEGNFSCRGMGRGRPRNTSQYCACERTNHTVGRQRVSMQFGGWGGFVGNLSHLLDGYWFSTPAQGECGEGVNPTGNGACTWKPQRVKKVVNATCVQRRVYAAIEGRAPACFSACAKASGPSHGADPAGLPDRRTPCVNSCFQNAVLGGGTGATMLAPIRKEEVLAPWNKAFESDDPAPSVGGCPPCVLGHHGVYHCPTPWN